MPLKIVDLEGRSLQDVAIGNGSSGVAIVSSYDWKSKMGKGTSPTLQKMVIMIFRYTRVVADDGDGDVVDDCFSRWRYSYLQSWIWL